MVQLLPLLEAVRDRPLSSTQRQDERRITTSNFRNHRARGIAWSHWRSALSGWRARAAPRWCTSRRSA